MHFSFRLSCISTAALLAAALTVEGQAQSIKQNQQTAQTTNQAATINQLERITVHGQSQELDWHTGASTLNHHDLQQRSITNWTDFSKRGEPGVNFNRQNKSVNVRGMDADRVVIRLDGVPLPWLNDGARGVQGGLNALSFNSLASLTFAGNAQAIKSGAITGALDLSSVSPSHLLRDDQSFGALLQSDYDSADYSRGVNATLAGRLANKTRWLVQAGTRRGDELRNKGGKGGYGPERTKVNPLDFKETAVLLKLEHDLSANHRLVANGERFDYKATLQNRRDQGPGTSFVLGHNSSKETIKRERLLLGYQYESSNPLAAIQQGEIKAWWQRMQLTADQTAQRLPDERGFIIPGDPFRYQFPHGDYRRDNATSQTSYGLTTEWSGFLQQKATLHNWSAGADWYRSRTKQSSNGFDNCLDIPPGLPDPFGPRSCDLLHTNQADMPQAKGDHLALWVQDEILWDDDRYAITPGLRFDSYRYRPQSGNGYDNNPNADFVALQSNSAKRFSPSLRVAFNPSDSLSFYASYTYGFKAPSPSQLYLNYGAPGTYLSVGNPNLRPETSRGLELGVVAGNDKLNGLLRVFDNRYRNFIDADYALTPQDTNWNPTWDGQYPMGVTMAVNRAHVRIYGAEASGHWQINSNWYTRAAIAWARGKNTTTQQPLNTIAPLQTHLVAGYEQATWGAEAQLTLATRRSRVAQPDNFKAPGYGTTDLSFWWQPAAVKGLRLQASVYNLFDKKYWEALNVPTSGRSIAPVNYYTEPGRSFRLAISYQY